MIIRNDGVRSYQQAFIEGKMKTVLGSIAFAIVCSQPLHGIPILSLDRLIHDAEISEVFKAGIFYLEIPHECKEHLEDALEFSYGFPKDEKIKAYTDGKFGGYHNREHNQIESFYVERKDWDTILPGSIRQLADKMTYLSDLVLKAALASSGLHEELWSEATGLLTEGGGQYHFSFNHYRFEKKMAGIKPHQDFGFVSILFVEKAGLEAFYKGQWEEVPPIKDRFVVIFGRAFEILVNDTSKLSGSLHRVRQLSEERVSFGVSCDNDPNHAVKRYLKEIGRLEAAHENYQHYLDECFNRT